MYDALKPKDLLRRLILHPTFQQVCHVMLTFSSPTSKKPATKSVAGFSFCSYLTAYRAALAFSTRAAKAAASWIAISDRLLRFISMPAFLTPFMNLE